MIHALSHHHSVFDSTAMIQRHEVKDREARPGFLTNFLDVSIDPAVHPEILSHTAGSIEGLPLPANWHADVAEWAATLRAVELSQSTFAMIELGCGWGCWVNCMGKAARRTGRHVDLVGVEADPNFLGYAVEALQRNGFAASDWVLHEGIAAATNGTALFPHADGTAPNWGREPMLDVSDPDIDRAKAEGGFAILDMFSLDRLIDGRDRIDLLHIDIQGGELDLVLKSIDLLNDKVAYMVIGTHSRSIEGKLFDFLMDAGWTLEVERPAILKLFEHGGHPQTIVDGLHGWRNPRLFD
ncbi:MAG: FkbM family methyltransferase [Alphaproteobacteria bacterium]|nr:MAG: FkbM family methyltransferase [Alphaproteobacteria bacterium]PZO40271.1 MAG: FkbM family methyltransferase [Alphaproteobacteria bacterium]